MSDQKVIEIIHMLFQILRQISLIPVEILTFLTWININLFAANLLIDTDEMMRYLKDGYSIVQTAGALDVNVNMLAIKLLEMRDIDVQLPFTINRQFLGRIEDRADSIG